MPEQVRRAFVGGAQATGESGPLLVRRTRPRVAGAALAVLVAGGGTAALLAGRFGEPGGMLGWPGFGGVAVGLSSALAAAGSLLQALRGAGAFPHGVYVFSTALVDARRTRLRLWPLSEVRASTRSGGRVLVEAPGWSCTFVSSSADSAVQRINHPGPANPPGAPFFDLSSLPAVKPSATARQLALAGLLLGLGYSAAHLRNIASDEAAFATLAAHPSRAGMLAYLEHCPRHAVEVMRVIRPRVELDEAAERGDLPALRALQKATIDLPQAEIDAAIHALYAKAHARLARFPPDDPAAATALAALLAWGEAHGDSRLFVHFNAPSVETDVEGTSAADPVVDASLSFSPGSVGLRGDNVVLRLNEGFTAVFGAELVQAEIGDDNAKMPTVVVSTFVAPSGIEYTVVDDPRRFVGIVVAFVATISVPGAEPFVVNLEVEPPPRFEVVDPSLGAVDAARVYDTMADVAYAAIQKRLVEALQGESRE